ncbi:hypothetical protein A0H76_1007 [Hepatospora eriocheir]|uniref:Uncharacterized protein n=1 Tax=Hepatospora eriocheir TaxID=1081669 RepID=A0A1X0QHT8_9MICR|nr:hypothetical protein A0H76_1007 [Hepatospora eriocheir]
MRVADLVELLILKNGQWYVLNTINMLLKSLINFSIFRLSQILFTLIYLSFRTLSHNLNHVILLSYISDKKILILNKI